MGLLNTIGRFGLAIPAALMLLLGALALGLSYLPDHPAVVMSMQVARSSVADVSSFRWLGDWGSSADLTQRFDEFLAGPARFVLAPLGAMILVGVLLPGGRKQMAESDVEDGGFPPETDRRELKRARKAASGLAKKGQILEAADFAFASGLLEEAAGYFIAGEEFQRAAEIRHDQNRFIESAELYLKGGSADSAGSIFSQQGEHLRAADAYLEAGNSSVAAEMYVKARQYSRAAECYTESGFARHAAQAYVKCERWEEAAQCLEAAILDEGALPVRDAKKQAELSKLHLMTGNLYQRAGLDERAQAILVKGGCHSEAAQVALARGEREEAASLFLESGEVLRGAEIRRSLGDTTSAALLMGEYHRDRGENAEAASCFEEAGESLAAGDLYRLLEEPAKAGASFERASEYLQAAEMFRLCDDRERAAANYEKAEYFEEAAECFALAGNSEREAAMLEAAGEYLRAGEIHQRDGRTDEAIKVLQRVDADSEAGAGASAVLGEIFRERGMFSLAVKKLNRAIGDQEIGRENVRAFFELASVHESNEDWQEACDIYEKILSFDYHYEDVEERLARAKQRLEAVEAAVATSGVDSKAALISSGRDGRYQIVGKLGRGGMGIVYKANDTVLDREVAFKVLPDALKENPQALNNFLREAKSAAKLNHPNIVTVYDAGEQDGLFYIAMEYVDGNTLKEIVKHRGRISPNGVVHVLSQMCEALAFAHEKKIVHRDIKTANTMWTRDRKTKIMDFGLAKVIEEVRNHTTVVSGTPYYMSPEQTLGKNVDHRTDIYSLGVTLFEIATAALPFREGNLPYHHVHTPPPDPREFEPELPDLIADIIAKCLRKDPADRYQSAKEILGQLRATLGG